ncbi:hypothetical protein [Vibrio phage JSF28]|uniref:Uncharacterized protein n=8 Tax=Chatterjeevirus ICP3 TaxID=2733612 RepID=A0A2D0YKD7_9CAUD|nr:hypothetical protein [Vibrio phage JSF25]ASV42879.1 hypothetical protein [Vibrio phage JSF28]ASV42980.1 hypothetical protein [Vibrio phage JSF31]ASV43005.1 hypothetical protein [Vibrio phage JSF32]ASV43101.1 hypothetical protein [Vibrio phage JSF35]ASV43162.1 hypothetical protein [Vibrio phage JSF36]ASV43207.1 hypothetical protein [Vibrio phage JSF18]QIW90094.1 hypothetical protein JSF37_00030 [Vibrio phage JSF37]
MSNTQKTTMTFTGNLSVDFTFIARDLETFEEKLKELQELSQGESFEKLPVKNQVMTKLVLEAYQKEGLEGGIRELVRFNLRNGMNELMGDEMTLNDKTVTMKVAPCRLKLDTAEKVRNQQVVVNAAYEQA